MDREKFRKEGKAKLLSYKESLEVQTYADGISDVFSNPVLREFLVDMDFSGLVEPFDYNAWIAQEKPDLDDPQLLASADLELLGKIITAHMRIDRFEEGHLDKLMAEGYFAAVLNRIEEL